MTIEQYWVGPKDREGVEDSGPYDSYDEAKAAAQEKRLCVICYEFEYADSYLVDDFTREEEE